MYVTIVLLYASTYVGVMFLTYLITLLLLGKVYAATGLHASIRINLQSKYPSHVITTLCMDYTFPTTCTGDDVTYIKNKKVGIQYHRLQTNAGLVMYMWCVLHDGVFFPWYLNVTCIK